jgi:hypothetical protein
VAVVNEHAASAWWPGSSPIGRRISIGRIWREIVGVARNTDVGAIGQPGALVLLPAAQDYVARPALVVQTSRGRPESLIEPLRARLGRIDSGIGIVEANTVAAEMALFTLPVRLMAAMMTVLGVSGLSVAMLGLYGVVAHTVRSRTREFAVRTALGAAPRQVRRLVLTQSLTMLVGGVVPGLMVAGLSAGLVRSLLFGVSAHDPLTFTIVPAALVGVGLLATHPPARRATRINPTDALREL